MTKQEKDMENRVRSVMTTFSELNRKLQRAAVVEELPEVQRGKKSAIDSLAEFQDVMAIIRAVKEANLAPTEKWKVFDLADVAKREPKLRETGLFRNFGLKARSLMAKQGVDHLLRLEARNKTTYYLVGKNVH